MSNTCIHNSRNKIWQDEQIPDDWCKGLLVKIPKKDDKSQCNNWSGITPLSIPSKIMKHDTDKLLREEQAGSRQDRPCVDQLATIRITSLYLNFVDFQKAFNSIDHNVLWDIPIYYGIPEKIMNMIKLLYENFTCHEINGGTARVITGVRQGCLFSPLLFINLLD